MNKEVVKVGNKKININRVIPKFADEARRSE